jgi:subtilisin family serine protease/N-acetylneuraminic acid mutarotase
LVLSGASTQIQAESPIQHTFKPPKSLDHPYVPGEVLVKFKNSPATFRGKPSRKHLDSLHGAAAAEFVAALPTKAQASLERVQGQVVRVHPSISLLRVKLPDQVTVGQAIDSLYRSGAVEYAEPNGLIIPQSIAPPDDLLFANQWGLFNNGTTGTAGADIKALDAWGIITGGKNAIVAVIDSGVDYSHEDLALNMWVNPGEIPLNLLDDDNNNVVDDYFGINTAVTPSTGDPLDVTGHGTAMAGIIGAVGNNKTGLAGINWQARIMALKCMTTTGTVDDAISTMDYARSQAKKEGAPLVLTLGWSQSPIYTYSNSMHNALRNAQLDGALVVIAAGNNNEDNDIFPNFPSSYNHDVKDFATPGEPVNPAGITMDNVISVGASDQFDKRVTISSTVGSSYGMATVDLFAPGKDIVCTLPGNKYGSGTGTSYAAAHVAGACALLWNRYPDKDWKQIKAMILNGAEDGLAQDFRAICVSEGRLNLANSLNPAIENAPAVFSIFEVPPTLDTDPAIVPGRADTNDTLVITGVNFVAPGPLGTPGTRPTVRFLDTTFPDANILSWSDEQIIATVPAGLPKGTGRLQVTNVTSGQTSRGACFSNISREKQVGSLIMGRGLSASAQVNNDVWVIGGRTYWGIVAQVEKYSLDTNHTVVDSDWMMPTPVSNAGAASIGSKIYVVGGSTEDSSGKDEPVANLQIFDTVTRTWQTGPPLPKALMQCAVASVGAKLYAFGGLVKSGSTTYSVVNDAYVFDPVANAWGIVTALPTATAYAAAAPTATGKIWVMGGFSTSAFTSQQRLVQEYDPAGNTWTQQRQLVRPRGGAAGINYGGQVYCLHGTKYPTISPTSAVYDAYADGEWYNLARGYWMPSIMNYLGIFVAPPKVLDRKGLYTPSPGKCLDNIFLLGGLTGTETDYKYSFSNKVWAFPAPGGGKACTDMTPILNLLLSSD